MKFTTRCLFPVLLVAVFAFTQTEATAQYIVSDAGPVNSAAAVGDAGNDTISSTVGAGTGGVYSRLDFRGDLTEVNTATFANEADWNIRNTTTGSSVNYGPTTTGNYTGTINVTDSVGGLFFFTDGDNMEFEAFESFDDGAGTDQTWTDVLFNFNTLPGFTSLGVLGGSGSSYTFDTEGSAFDTELAIYTNGGMLIANDDDGGTGTASSITSTLTTGDYIAVVGGFNSFFDNGLALAGGDNGTYNLNVNSVLADSGSIAANEFGYYTFSIVVPEPASWLVGFVAFGLISAKRRRAA